MVKLVKASKGLISMMALLSNSLKQNLVNASFQTVEQGVVRIDLEKKYINHFNNLMLSDDIDMDKMILVDNQVRSDVEIDLILDPNENNYSVLREQQRKGKNGTK